MAPLEESQSSPQGYHIKVSLQDISPEIWREVIVPSDITLEDLHYVMQGAMGWLDCHLHAFIKDRKFYSIPDDERFDDDLDDNPDLDSSQYTISDFLSKKGDSIEYMYDMGDGWEHKLVLKKVLDEAPETPLCTGGARACPPEDAGGPPGYENLLKALKDPGHEMHEEYKEWLGVEFDSEWFDLEETNDGVQELYENGGFDD